MRATPVPGHTRGEQQRIADFLDERVARIDQIIAARCAQITALEDIRPSALDAGLRVTGDSVPLKRIARPVDVRASDLTLPLLSVSIHHGVQRRESIAGTPGRADDLGSYKVVRRGQIVVNRMRAFQGALGIANEAGLASPDYLVLEAADGMDAQWLAATLRSPRLVGEMTARLRGIGGTELGAIRTPRVNWEDMAQIRITVPRPEQQKELARDTSEHEMRISQLATGLRTLVGVFQEYKQSLITAAVTGELDVTTASTRIPGE